MVVRRPPPQCALRGIAGELTLARTDPKVKTRTLPEVGSCPCDLEGRHRRDPRAALRPALQPDDTVQSKDRRDDLGVLRLPGPAQAIELGAGLARNDPVAVPKARDEPDFIGERRRA